jgi:hypothetical protein
MPCCSKQNPLIQIADFYAGIAQYSYTAFDKYEQWLDENSNQQTLFHLIDDKVAVISISNRDYDRLEILHYLRKQCGKCKMQISLKSTRGLCSNVKFKEINFWKYNPQSQLDKAPSN